jgi:phenylalanine ammonia-lyase
MNMPPAPIRLDGESLTLEHFVEIAANATRAEFADGVTDRVQRSRDVLDEKLQREEIIYGVNTGFGGNVKFLIPVDEIDSLQRNLLNSLSCGTGPELPIPVVRGAIVLRANALSKGYSGVRPLVVDRLLALLNAGITPIVPRYGSVGASGDLVPSAYIARVLLGEGIVEHQGQRRPAAEALAAAGIEPITLKSKEGLALLNGTTVMTSLAAFATYEAEALAKLTLASVAFCSEVLTSSVDAYEEEIHRIKSHPGQIEAARLLRACVQGSSLVQDLDSLREQIRREHAGAHRGEHAAIDLEESIQTPYSLRCAPQGLGAALDGVAFARQVVEREMNSVNDNPLIDAARGRVYHTGNFYGGHVARAMDGLKIDLANLANWAHALMAMLMDPRFSNGLPPNLSLRPGLHSGFKGMQLSQTSLVVACRQMCAPSSIHTLPTEQYNQDIVSLGLHSAAGAADMAERVRDTLSILLLALCQAAEFRGVPDKARLGELTGKLYANVRERSAPLDHDRPLDGDIAAVSHWIAVGGGL